MSDVEYDNFQDDFADIGDADWERILPAHPSEQIPQPEGVETVQLTLESTAGDQSDNYFDDDEPLDSSFLAALEDIERRATHPVQAGPSRMVDQRTSGHSGNPSLVTGASHMTRRVQRPSDETLSLSLISGQDTTPALKRIRSGSNSPFAPSKKGKIKAKEVNHEPYAVIGKLEEEFMCPVCFDILVCAHIANPCGHSFCGDCGWNWIVTLKKNTCPACRTVLERTTQMIPNIVLDSAIEKYIEILAHSGIEEWGTRGKTYIEWAGRKRKWKNAAARRAKQNVPRPKHRRVAEHAPIWVDEQQDPTYQDVFEFDEGSFVLRAHMPPTVLRALARIR